MCYDAACCASLFFAEAVILPDGTQGAHAMKIKNGASNEAPILERMMGVEPTLSAWEAGVLPINYIREAYPLDRQKASAAQVDC